MITNKSYREKSFVLQKTWSWPERQSKIVKIDAVPTVFGYLKVKGILTGLLLLCLF